MADNKIREYREKLGMTQKELADKIGVGFTTLYSWENGGFQPKVFNAICLAQALGTTVEELFSP